MKKLFILAVTIAHLATSVVPVVMSMIYGTQHAVYGSLITTLLGVNGVIVAPLVSLVLIGLVKREFFK